MDYNYSILLSLILSLFLLLKLLFPAKTRSKTLSPLPPSPPSLPIVGHLLHLQRPLHRSLAALTSLHSSPILFLRFGSRPTLLVSSLPLFDECFTTNDLAFASRPQLPSTKSITYNCTTLASAPYGPHWRNTRRIVTVELLSSACLNSLSSIRRDEVKSLLHSMFLASSKAHAADDQFKEVELKPMLASLMLNMMTRTIAGRRNNEEEETRFREMMNDSLKLIGVSNLSDFLPVLRVLDFGGVKRRIKRLNEKKEAMLQGLIDETRTIRREQPANGGSTEDHEKIQEQRKKKKKTMLEVLIDLQEQSPESCTDQNIKATIMVST